MAETKIKKAWYKRWWAIVIFILIALFIIGGLFDGKKDSSSKIEEKIISNTKEDIKNYSVGEYIQAGDFKWKILKVSKSKEIGNNPFFTKEANGIFLIIDVEVENTGKTAKYLSGDYLKLIDKNGREFSPNSGDAIYLGANEALVFEQINPGIIKKGKVVFDVPEDINEFKIKISSNLVTSKVYNVRIVLD